jgi:NAD(P)-dependent dehydrogenase (short-subunit alcohol dehydrogenase family)
MRRVLANAGEYAENYRLELCRNCERSPQNRRQTPPFRGSYQEAFRGGKSLNRLRKGLLRYYSLSDVRDTQSIRSAVDAGLGRFGRIDALVNNAGYGAYGPLEGGSR